jgi:regulator of replication initiation timing
VNPPNDRNNLSFDGGDERSDGSDDNTVVIANPRDSEPPASPDSRFEPPAIQQWLWELQTSILHTYPREGPIPPGIPQILEVSAATHMVLVYSRDRKMEAHHVTENRLDKIEERVITLKTDQHRLFDNINSKMDNLLQKMDAAWTENTALREAYHESREETAALKVAVDTLMKKLNENIAITTPPSPNTATSSTAMEEMMMQLSHIQHDIQDILDAVRNPPGK